MKILAPLLLLLISLSSQAARLAPEETYRAKFCNGNKQVTLRDNTRADCFLFKKDMVIEVDFADKWYQGIGQAIHYSNQSNRKPGVALIIEKETDCRYVARAIAAVKNTYVRMFNGEMVRIELFQVGPLRCITGTITR